MKMSQMPYTAGNSKQQILNFGGINYSPRYNVGDFISCENLSADEYPWLSQKKSTEKAFTYTDDTPAGTYTSPVAIYAKDKMCVIDSDGKFYYDGEETTGHIFDVSNDIQMVAVNTKIIIMPDAWYFDIPTKKLYPMTAKIMVQCATEEGGNYRKITVTANTITCSFTSYFGAGFTSFADFTDVNSNNNKFLVGDIVKLWHSGGDVIHEGAVIRKVDEYTLTFDNNTFAVDYHKSYDSGYFYIERLPIPTADGATEDTPLFDYICEHDNRLWGVKNLNQTIYGSELGNPLNFNVFEGLSTDSYAVAVGSAENFTGCISFGSYICFFKENMVYKLYGNKPSNYQLVKSIIQGVEEGAHKSLQIIRDVLYYKGRQGIYSYVGGVPDLISDNLGTVAYDGGVAGTDGVKYFISMHREADENIYDFLVYDTLKNIWLRIDNSRIEDFAYMSNKLYFLVNYDRNYFHLAGEGEEADPSRIFVYDSGNEVFDWSAILCPFYENTQQRKSYLRLFIRYEPQYILGVSTGTLNIYKKVIGMDDDFVLMKTINYTVNTGESTVEIPLQPNRCDSFMIKLTGTGRCYIKSFVREYQTGSER